MKTTLTILFTIIFGCLIRLYEFSYPVITARATAAQMDDTNESWLLARLVMNGRVETILCLIYIALIAIIWASTLQKLITNKNTKTP